MNRQRLIKIAFFVFLCALVALAVFNKDHINLEELKGFVEGTGFLGPLVFVLIYIVAAIAFLPSFVFTMFGGLLFGIYKGALLSLFAASLGAMLSFLSARYLASDWLENSSSKLLEKLRKGTQEQGWRFVAFTRLIPIFPYNLQNYGYGLTKIPCCDFTTTTFITMAPSTFVFAYLGHIGTKIVF